ncbi:hypothetical protein JRO89_XSUnG0150800 [Xanthoceras sorbifolium]|uniref:RanBD1 domain-containing protein n=1 Tax=Xanthoceras sorbifolium TaxID=99658 RepID=A0ABQ8GXX9_9ROSI|nr:hypothetical protein JRO89_XSUnG0150800 [Xanthoceras sorbifolium]
MASTTSATDPEQTNREEEEAPHNEDEDTGAQVAPIVKLEEVAVTTGEEDEDAILDLRWFRQALEAQGERQVLPTMSVQEHAGNDKSCVWHATDFADGELKDEVFCIRFGSVENCKKFMDAFQEVAESQKQKEENKDATAAAGLLEKLSVEEKKTEEKDGEEVPAAAKEKESKTEDAENKDEKPAPST